LVYLPTGPVGGSPLPVEADRVIRLVAHAPAEEGADPRVVTLYAPAPTPSAAGLPPTGVSRLRALEAKKLHEVGKARRVTSFLVLALLLVALAVLVAAWLGYVSIPGVSLGIPLSLATPG
jgi:hypothetical protein